MYVCLSLNFTNRFSGINAFMEARIWSVKITILSRENIPRLILLLIDRRVTALTMVSSSTLANYPMEYRSRSRPLVLGAHSICPSVCPCRERVRNHFSRLFIGLRIDVEVNQKAYKQKILWHLWPRLIQSSFSSKSDGGRVKIRRTSFTSWIRISTEALDWWGGKDDSQGRTRKF